jgi:hypothetical protein
VVGGGRRSARLLPGAPVGELLLPISLAMAHELLAGNYIQADQTPVRVERAQGKIIKLVFGNTAGLGQQPCSTSDGRGNGKVPHSSCVTSRVYFKPTVMRHMTMWVAPGWCMRPAGHMPDVSFSSSRTQSEDEFEPVSGKRFPECAQGPRDNT